jgi:hypothetical protein
VEDARFNVLPVHKGPLLFAVGVAGGFGSAREKGPTAFETHPFNVTEISE